MALIVAIGLLLWLLIALGAGLLVVAIVAGALTS